MMDRGTISTEHGRIARVPEDHAILKIQAAPTVLTEPMGHDALLLEVAPSGNMDTRHGLRANIRNSIQCAPGGSVAP